MRRGVGDYDEPEPHVIFRRPRLPSECPHHQLDTVDGAREGRRMDNSRDYFHKEEEDEEDGAEERSYLVLEKDTYFPSGRREAGEAVREEMYERGMREDERNNEVGRNYFPSDRTQVKRRGGRYYIELAIFVDRDLQKDMFENFPDDTDEHIVHVVLAMINAVSDSEPDNVSHC